MRNLSWGYILLSAILLTGCQKSSHTVWEDTKTIGRYLQRKSQLIWKQDLDSKMVESENAFVGPQEEEYLPLKEKDLKKQFADHSIPQPKEVPGAIGSRVPSIDQFKTPSSHLVHLFKNFYFNTDEHALKTKDDHRNIVAIAEYMKNNDNLYLFIEGHCDERASEAYNLALGTRRANTIRVLLVEHGVNSDHIYTISFGKEIPAKIGHTPEIWAKNRRVEFKIFEKKGP